MKSNTYLATTAISEIWDRDAELLLLGEWCLSGSDLNNRAYKVAPSHWKPAAEVNKANDYCWQIYRRVIPQLADNLNSLHGVSYDNKYWQILLGVWLICFISAFYDRYARMHNAINLFPQLYTSVIPRQDCNLSCLDTYDFTDFKLCRDYYNLKLFSIIAYDLLPERLDIINYQCGEEMPNARYSLRRKLFFALLGKADALFGKGITLSEMYHLTAWDIVRLKFKEPAVRFLDLEPTVGQGILTKPLPNLRHSIKLTSSQDRFEKLLYDVIPQAVPLCYIENYASYQSGIQKVNIEGYLGSATGWYYNEKFKFLAGQAYAKGAKLIAFQHGGGFGACLSVPLEDFMLKKDIFYTWGWDLPGNNARPLPSARLSKLRGSHKPRLNKVLFVSTSAPRYQLLFASDLMPEDMAQYFENQTIFFRNLKKDILKDVVYRPINKDFGWGELNKIKGLYPEMDILEKPNLARCMQKVKLVAIDHPHTSFLEALSINVPCIFYWDKDIFQFRKEAQGYFDILTSAGILYGNPLSAAHKLNEIASDPLGWWNSNHIQDARAKFCGRFALSDKDWLGSWQSEFSNLKNN